MKQILLDADHVALVDDEDYNDLVQFKWSLFKNAKGRVMYAVRNTYKDGKRVSELMHKRITGYERTDHINGNGLDNRRQNLRSASNTQNIVNSRKRRGDCTSKYKGVCWDKRRNLWVSYIRVNKILIYLGRFTDEVEAAKVYDAAALIHFGLFANLNFEE